MCGRFTNTADGDELAERFGAKLVAGFSDRHAPRFNVAPTQKVAAVVNSGERVELRRMRWGLVPHWAKDKPRLKLVNAKAETLLEKPAYRGLARKHRCLIPADGFYEWRTNEEGGREPVRFTLADRQLFAFAGLWTAWVDGTGEPMDSCTVITTTPNELVAAVHDRMPVILPRGVEANWLDPDLAVEHAVSLLEPFPAELMRAAPASVLVNSVRNEGPELLAA